MAAYVTRLAAYGLIVAEQKILLCRLSAQNDASGRWTLPGGGLEFGEHPETAVVREVFEETGLDIHLQGLLEVQSEVFTFPQPRQAIRFIYRATVSGGTLVDEVHGSTDLAAWHTAAEAARLPKVRLATRGVELAFG